jgi:hypothetical protein
MTTIHLRGPVADGVPAAFLDQPDGEAARVMFRIGCGALLGDPLAIFQASPVKQAFSFAFKSTGSGRMARCPGQLIGRLVVTVAMTPAPDNDRDPADQDSRPSFPDIDAREACDEKPPMPFHGSPAVRGMLERDRSLLCDIGQALCRIFKAVAVEGFGAIVLRQNSSASHAMSSRQITVQRTKRRNGAQGGNHTQPPTRRTAVCASYRGVRCFERWLRYATSLHFRRRR